MLTESTTLEAAIKLAYRESHATLRSCPGERYLPPGLVEPLANVNCSPAELDSYSRFSYPANLVQCLKPFSDAGLPRSAVEGPDADELRRKYEDFLAKASELQSASSVSENGGGEKTEEDDCNHESGSSVMITELAHAVTSDLEGYLDQSLRTADSRLVDYLELMKREKGARELGERTE